MTNLMVDLSNNNFGGDPKKVASVDFGVFKQKAGGVGCGIKLTQGSAFVDDCHTALRAAAQAHGLWTLFYHFADGDSPKVEAEHFLANLPHFNVHDRRFYLDFEKTNLPANWAREFNHVVVNATGVIPGFYSYSALIANLHLTVPIGDGLWLANYNRDNGKEYPASPPPGWAKIVAHQFTSNARVAGIPFPCDMSHVLLPNALLIPIPGV